MKSIRPLIKEYYRKYKRYITKGNLSMTEGNTLCAIPWTHLNFEPNGKVVPCCLTSTHNYFAGDLNTDSIEELWNSQNMKNLRKEMMSGIEPKICKKCFDAERVTGESGRYYNNKAYPEVLKQIPDITLEDGTCTTMELKYWDFRFSNLCNFKCRSCGPRYSSAWVPDAKKLGYADQEKVWSIDSVDDMSNFDFLNDQVQHVKVIYFAGGEPLLMPEHWQILELLVKNNRFDVKLKYNTNASVLEYNKQNVLDYWKQWQDWKIEVWPSIDEIDDRAELIRSGTVWKTVETNLIEMNKLDNVTVRPGLTIGAWNVFRLPEIITRLVDLGIVREKHKFQNFFINLIFEPDHYHVDILPNDYKKEISKKLLDFIESFNKKHNTKIDHIFTHILHELDKPFNVRLAKKFLDVTKQIDGIRNEDLFKTIPEMVKVRDAIEHKEKNLISLRNI